MTRSAFTFEKVETGGNTNYKLPRELLRVDGVDYFGATVNLLFFKADDDSGNGQEVFFVDSSFAPAAPDTDTVLPGSSLVSDYFHNLNAPKQLTVVDNGAGEQFLFFTGADALDNTDNVQLWTTPLNLPDGFDDGFGTTDFTKLIINATGSAKVDQLTEFNGELYFRATDNTNGVELWRVDLSTPSSPAVTLVSDIFTSGSSNPNELTAVNNSSGNDRLYFKATTYGGAGDQGEGSELWVHDPSGTPTIVTTDGLASIRPGRSSSSPSKLTAVGDRLFFSARGATNGKELWTVDNNKADVADVKATEIDIRSGSRSSSPTNLTGFDDGTNKFLFFTAYDGTSSKLFKYDLGTSSYAQVVGTEDLSRFANFYVVQDNANDDLLVFTAFREDVGSELWAYDPLTGMMIDGDTGSGVLDPIVEPNPGSSSSNSTKFSYDDTNNLLYFAATGTSDDGGLTNIGKELWRFDPYSRSGDIFDLGYADIYTGTNSQGIPFGSVPTEITPFYDITNNSDTVYFQGQTTDGLGNFIGSVLLKATS